MDGCLEVSAYLAESMVGCALVCGACCVTPRKKMGYGMAGSPLCVTICAAPPFSLKKKSSFFVCDVASSQPRSATSKHRHWWAQSVPREKLCDVLPSW